jgi:hypothetical protein
LLDDKVRSRIRELLRDFEEWLKSEEARVAIKDRSVKLREFQTLLSEENVEGLTIVGICWMDKQRLRSGQSFDV